MAQLGWGREGGLKAAKMLCVVICICNWIFFLNLLPSLTKERRNSTGMSLSILTFFFCTVLGTRLVVKVGTDLCDLISIKQVPKFPTVIFVIAIIILWWGIIIVTYSVQLTYLAACLFVPD